MEYARPRSSEMSMTNVQILIDKTLELVETRLYKRKVHAVTSADPQLPVICADAQQLTQVSVNLYLNAIDAMPNGGELSVTARTVD